MASFVENVNKVAALIPAESVDLGVVADNIDNINLLKPVITDLQSIVNNVVPNIAEILLADDNAATATTKAGEASTSASQALGYRNEALGFRNEAEAFNESKAFVVDTVEDLLTIPSSYVTAVVRDLNRGGTFIWSPTGTANGGTVFAGATGYWVRQYSGAVNVKWFGAKGDGTNELTIFQNIANSIKDGDSLYIPAGTYKGGTESSDDDLYYMIITKHSIEIFGDGDSTIFNVPIKVRGSVSEPVNVGGTSFGSGDEKIYLANSLGLADRDWVQLWGVCHPFSGDAGDYQLGGYNPTKQQLYDARFGEFLQVRDIVSSTEIDVMSPVIYPKYQNSTSGLTTTISGVTSAQVVKVSFVNGFSISNMKFTTTSTSFDRLNFNYVRNIDISNITFDVLNNEDGRWIRTTSCIDVTISNCIFNRDITDYTGGSSWNSVIIGGGSQNALITNCSFYNEAQTVDFTNGIVEMPTSFVGEYLSYTNTAITGCSFNNCSDSGTWHPGGYISSYTNNNIVGGNGLRLRSRKNIVSGNSFSTETECLSVSAFYYDTLITNNVFTKPYFSNTIKNNADWTAILFSNWSSETNNGNVMDRVKVSSNIFTNQSSGVAYAVRIRNYGNGVNPISLLSMTTMEKLGVADIEFSYNLLNSCSILIERYNSGLNIISNNFMNTISGNAYIEYSLDTGGGRIVDNFFEYSGTHLILPPSQFSTSFKAFTISLNKTRGTFNVINTLGVAKYNDTLTMMDSIIQDKITTSDGGGLEARRVSGDATLYLDARPLNGTGAANVIINNQANTTGVKRLYNYGIFYNDGHISPLVDNTHKIGQATYRWSVIYAGTGTINTSDDREKTYIDITEAEKQVAVELKANMKKFKFNDAIESKGEKARTHFGTSAQTVKSIFEKYGLNGFDYAILCYDEWEEQEEVKDEEGNIIEPYRPAGDRYGIRYEELLCFIISAM